jgi:hypothetical protein
LEQYSVEDPRNSAHLPSECLVYLVRSSGNNPSGMQKNTDLMRSNIRIQAFGSFAELLPVDHVNDDEPLEYFKVRFNYALVSQHASVVSSVGTVDC